MTQHGDDVQDALDQLSILGPTTAERPRPAGQALARLRVLTAERQRVARPGWNPFLLWRFTMTARRNTVVAILLVVLVFGVAFSFPAVRAAASDFLGLFRVQKFAAISVSPEQLARLEEIAEQGLYPGQLEMISDPGQPQIATSLREAARLAGQPVRSPAALGQPTRIEITRGGSARLTIDLQAARTLLDIAGADPTLLPDSLEGATVDATIYPAVYQEWADGTAFVQTESPLVDYPDDVDPAVIGEALLQALGMERDRARDLAQSIDWANTLLLPVPTNVATFSEVRVEGQVGLGLSSIDGQGNVILWQRGGRVYMLMGDQDVNELVRVAESLR